LLLSLHLDYLSCLLTIASTVLVGRRMWQGWVVAGINSVIICAIGLRTGQWGFVPANVFCLAIYAYNLRSWRVPGPVAAGAAESPMAVMSARLDGKSAVFTHAAHERLTSHRIRSRAVPDQREARPSL
jgi:hypothetical protein